MLAFTALLFGCTAEYETTGKFTSLEDSLFQSLDRNEKVDSDFMWVESDDGTGFAELKIYISRCHTESLKFDFMLKDAISRPIAVSNKNLKGIHYDLMDQHPTGDPNFIAQISVEKYFDHANPQTVVAQSAHIYLYRTDDDKRLVGTYYNHSIDQLIDSYQSPHTP